jgi:hypothetical protein
MPSFWQTQSVQWTRKTLAPGDLAPLPLKEGAGGMDEQLPESLANATISGQSSITHTLALSLKGEGFFSRKEGRSNNLQIPRQSTNKTTSLANVARLTIVFAGGETLNE